MASREVDAAVLAATQAEVLTTGLPFDQCDLTILMGTASNVPGQLEQFRASYAAVLPHTRGHFIVNADDPGCLSIIPLLDPERVALVSTQPDDETITAHLEAGGCAAWIEVESDHGVSSLHLMVGTRRRSLTMLRSALKEQSIARHNLIAAAAGWALGWPDNLIEGL
jgi:hypothetical protein